MRTISSYMHRVSEGNIFSYVGLQMSTIWLAKDTVFIIKLAHNFLEIYGIHLSTKPNACHTACLLTTINCLWLIYIQFSLIVKYPVQLHMYMYVHVSFHLTLVDVPTPTSQW